MAESRPNLVVVYGPRFSGTKEVATAIAGAMPGRSAVLSADALLQAIVVPWDDAGAELEMVHEQIRHLAVYYLKHRYHLVVEGPFLFERAGRLLDYQSHIDQLLALMRNLIGGQAIVRLEVAEETLRERAREAGYGQNGEASVRLAGAYRSRSGPTAFTFDTAADPPAAIAAVVQKELAKGADVGR